MVFLNTISTDLGIIIILACADQFAPSLSFLSFRFVANSVAQS